MWRGAPLELRSHRQRSREPGISELIYAMLSHERASKGWTYGIVFDGRKSPVVHFPNDLARARRLAADVNLQRGYANSCLSSMHRATPLSGAIAALVGRRFAYRAIQRS